MCNPGAAMRFLTSVVFLAAAVPTLAVARNVYDSHFAGAGNHACFVRSYDNDHLAKHPQQQVTQIGVMISPLGGDSAEPMLDVFVAFRGTGFEYHGLGYCRRVGDALACQMEGDAGSFTLTGQKNHKILLTVGRDDLSFEGETDFRTLSGSSGDDRSFLLPSLPADLCY